MSMMGPLPEPEVVIKKVKAKGNHQHHGGAWKVAYADFVTAMMAFFLLMWLLGSVDQNKRRGIANYFTPTAMDSEKSGGSVGLLGGHSIDVPDGGAPQARKGGLDSITPTSTKVAEAVYKREVARKLTEVENEIRQKIQEKEGLSQLQGNIKFTQTPEGLRIELIDKEDYSMFSSGTSQMDPRSRDLLQVVASVVAPLPQKLAIRGHTDSRPYASQGVASGANNWTLSSARAESTRVELARAGIPSERFARLEGVADTQPHIPHSPMDPRNRRMSVTLLNQ